MIELVDTIAGCWRGAFHRQNLSVKFQVVYKILIIINRISPHPPSPQTPRRERHMTPPHASSTTAPIAPQEKPAEPQKPAKIIPEIELDIPPSPPPVEETLAARRARRAAIMAKYAQGNSDADTSAVQPPSSAPVTNQVPLAPSLDGQSLPESRGQSVVASRCSLYWFISNGFSGTLQENNPHASLPDAVIRFKAGSRPHNLSPRHHLICAS
jgi:hypothetical protein